MMWDFRKGARYLLIVLVPSPPPTLSFQQQAHNTHIYTQFTDIYTHTVTQFGPACVCAHTHTHELPHAYIQSLLLEHTHTYSPPHMCTHFDTHIPYPVCLCAHRPSESVGPFAFPPRGPVSTPVASLSYAFERE